MARKLEGMIAVGDQNIKALGYLTWFSVPDQEVSLRSLRAKWQIHGLNPAPLPKDTRAINTFKRAMRDQAGRQKTNGNVTETTVAPVTESSEDCVYQITRLVRDVDERVVDYPKAMRVIFSKVTDEISFNPLGGIPRAEVLPMMEAVQRFYDDNAKKVTGAKVRTLVRNYLRNDDDETTGTVGLSGENLRDKAGGIYFVPARHRDALEALKDCLDDLYPDHRAYLHYVPMADTKTEREIIRRHHVGNTAREMKEAIAEAKGYLATDRDRAPRSDVIANQWGRFRRLQRRSQEYAALLEDEQDEITQMGDILHRQLLQL